MVWGEMGVKDVARYGPVGDCVCPILGDRGRGVCGVGEKAGVVEREFPRETSMFAASVSSMST